jgi:hypothetical protein
VLIVQELVHFVRVAVAFGFIVLVVQKIFSFFGLFPFGF